MRVLLAFTLPFAIALSGCAHKQPAPASPSASPRAGTAAVSGKTALGGVVSRVEPVGRFVVLTFPPGQMAAVDEHLAVYRHGAKVGEVKVSGPQRDNNTVADIVTGQPEVGDEVRLD